MFATIDKLLALNKTDHLSPMMVRELWQGLRRGIFVIPFIVVQALAIIATLAEVLIAKKFAYSEFVGVGNVFMLFTSGPFWIATGLMCGIIMPLSAITLMESELEEGNHELLQMTNLTRWQIIIGKWVAVWVLCLLTLSSLFPYVIVRYFQGSMDVGRNVAMALTIVALSATVTALALGAASFKTMSGRFIAFFGLSISAILSSLPAMAFSALRANSCGVFFHLNALAAFASFTILGLALARSRIRLKIHHFEVKPSILLLSMIGFAPFFAGIATLITFGYLGFIGLAVLGVAAWFSDPAPKAAIPVADPNLTRQLLTQPQIHHAQPPQKMG